MGELQPNEFTGVPYLPQSHRGLDGYMNRLDLDNTSRQAIFEARKKSSHILDGEDGIFHTIDMDISSCNTEGKNIEGMGSIEISRDDIDGGTVIEDIRKYAFNFHISKTSFRLGSIYGGYDEYEVTFEDFSIIGPRLSEALRLKLELKIKEQIITKVKSEHIHINGED